MKTLKKALFLVLLGALTIFVSCEKDPIVPEPVGQPVITISQSLSSDGVVTVKWEVKNVDAVFCNGMLVVNNSVSFPVCDSTLVFMAKNKLYNISEIIQVSKPASPTGEVSFTYNGVAVDSLPYPGGEIVATVNFTNGFLVFNDITYKKSPVSITLSTIGTDVFDFTIKGVCEEITIPLVVPVKDLTTREQQIIFGSWYEGYSRESYTGPDGPWEETNIDYSDPCVQDNVWKFFVDTQYQRKVNFDQGVLCAGGVAPIFTFGWRIEDDSIFIGNGPATRLIKSIDWSSLVYMEIGEYDKWDGTKWISYPCWYEKTFYHHPQR